MLNNSSSSTSVGNILLYYPVGLYTVSFLSYLATYFIEPSPWYNIAFAANIGGMVMSVAVLVVDNIEQRKFHDRHKKLTAAIQNLFNLIALLLFAANLGIAYLREGQPLDVLNIALTSVGVVSIFCAEWCDKLMESKPVANQDAETTLQIPELN